MHQVLANQTYLFKSEKGAVVKAINIKDAMEESRSLLLLWNPVIEMCLNIHICMFIKFSIHGTLEVLDIFVTPFITLSWLVQSFFCHGLFNLVAICFQGKCKMYLYAALAIGGVKMSKEIRAKSAQNFRFQSKNSQKYSEIVRISLKQCEVF